MKLLKLFLVGLGLAAAACASAETYPSEPVTVVVPLTPGGASDTVVRARDCRTT